MLRIVNLSLTLVLLTAILSSCSSFKMIEPRPEEPPLHSTSAVLDLGRSAYLKGCVDGFNRSVDNKIPVFEVCTSMAKTYEAELKELLEQEIEEYNEARR